MSRVEKAYTEEEPTTPKRNATLDYKAGSNYIEVIGRVSHKMRRLHFVIDGDVDRLHELPTGTMLKSLGDRDIAEEYEETISPMGFLHKNLPFEFLISRFSFLQGLLHWIAGVVSILLML